MMPQTKQQNRIVDLAAEISQHTQIIDSYLSQHGIETLTFEPRNENLTAINIEIASSRNRVLAATTELNELLLGPSLFPQFGFQISRLIHLHMVYRHRIANKVPIEGSISYGELAECTNVKESVLRHVLRHAMVWRLFQEKTPHQVSHSALSKVLAEDSKAHDFLGNGLEMMYPGIIHTPDALDKWPEADEPAQSGWLLAQPDNNGANSMYQYLAQYPEKRRRWEASLGFMSQENIGHSISYVAEAYQWDDLKVVVDVGGHQGEAAFAITKKYPSSVQVIVQDQPHVLKDVVEQPGQNVSFMTHDFFAAQPIANADAYLMRMILHNWSDKYAICILRALIPALKPKAKILIMDDVTPEINSDADIITQRQARNWDMLMLSVFNSSARELDEWQDLFKRADERFCFVKVTKPKGSFLSLLEFEWNP